MRVEDFMREDLVRYATQAKTKAEKEDVDAQYYLGQCYEIGEGVEKDMVNAAYWYNKAAEHGDADARYKLALCYDEGRGVDQDMSLAVEWYRKAADQGHVYAQYDLACCYDEGQGVDENMPLAFKWYKEAAMQGNVDAQSNLEKCYRYGLGVKENEQEANKLHEKAAEQKKSGVTTPMQAVINADSKRLNALRSRIDAEAKSEAGIRQLLVNVKSNIIKSSFWILRGEYVALGNGKTKYVTAGVAAIFNAINIVLEQGNNITNVQDAVKTIQDVSRDKYKSRQQSCCNFFKSAASTEAYNQAKQLQFPKAWLSDNQPIT